MKMTSRFALVAAAGMLMAVAPAKAADLGGGCCADLEERVAELEATTARKGNRVVSLQVYGQVNKALLVWDDGFDDDAYVVDNDFSMSRIGFRGSASMKEGWTAGYHIELGVRNDSSGRVDQTTDDAADQILIRHNNVYIESATFGRVTIGQQDTATAAITEINLGGSHENSYGNYGSFFIRDSTFGFGLGRIGDFQNNLNGGRASVIRYDTPSIYGFIASASWGEDDRYDLALRFRKEWNSIRIAAGIGYGVNDEAAAVGLDVLDPSDFSVTDVLDGLDIAAESEVLSGSISVMHVPTGIYGMFAAGEVDFDFGGGFETDGDFWYAQVGIERRITPYGSTVFFGEYGDYEGVTPLTSLVDGGTEMWGVGVTQNFDSAALQIYASYRTYEFDVDALPGLELEDFDAFLIGSVIKF